MHGKGRRRRLLTSAQAHWAVEPAHWLWTPRRTQDAAVYPRAACRQLRGKVEDEAMEVYAQQVVPQQMHCTHSARIWWSGNWSRQCAAAVGPSPAWGCAWSWTPSVSPCALLPSGSLQNVTAVVAAMCVDRSRPDVLTQKEARLDFVNAHGSSVEVFARQCARILGLAVAAARRRDHRCWWRCGKWLHVHVQLLHTQTDIHTHTQRDRNCALYVFRICCSMVTISWGASALLCFALCALFTLLSRSPSSRPTSAAGNGLPSAAATVACCVAHFPAAPSHTNR